MILNFVFNSNNQLCGVFDEEHFERFVNTNDYQTAKVEASLSQIIDCNKRYEYWNLFEISIDNNNHWVIAQGYGAAIVEGVLMASKNSVELKSVKRYDIPMDDYNQILNVKVDEYILYSPAKRIIDKITLDNRDLCALLLDNLQGIQSEEALKKRELSSLRMSNIDVMDASKIRELFLFWYDYGYAECNDMTFEQGALYWQCHHLTDKEQTLFWSYIFAFWGGYRSILPYTLFERIINDKFADLYDDFSKKRLILVK